MDCHLKETNHHRVAELTLSECPRHTQQRGTKGVALTASKLTPFLPSVALRDRQLRISIYRCEALDVRFPMELEPYRLDLCSSSYDQISDKRSGLTALGEFWALIFGREFLIESLRTGRSVHHESCRY
ncbi:hypothetical protein PIB30_069305 [Stylosanthes scabra]|uniref:Uncharacterized protein n=1 Tax=Stylosanthes scabra TaxID=79078 RepID=A0ABU6TMT8_9FABA|nr:hypothetical protein [Stylosanthes scabra]